MFKIRRPLSVVLALGAALPAATGHAQKLQLSSLKSVNVELPQGDRQFPPGPGADAVTKNCLACHSAEMILNQPAMSKATWDAEVNKMINTYKAPIAADDVAAIIGYLEATKGAGPVR